jgi:hypothetical protein
MYHWECPNDLEIDPLSVISWIVARRLDTGGCHWSHCSKWGKTHQRWCRGRGWGRRACAPAPMVLLLCRARDLPVAKHACLRHGHLPDCRPAPPGRRSTAGRTATTVGPPTPPPYPLLCAGYPTHRRRCHPPSHHHHYPRPPPPPRLQPKCPLHVHTHARRVVGPTCATLHLWAWHDTEDGEGGRAIEERTRAHSSAVSRRFLGGVISIEAGARSPSWPVV